jgi:orotate phosphoribosyltransferase
MKIEVSSDYLQPALEHKQVARTVKALVALIKHTNLKFSTIVFRGMSGALIAPIVAYKLHKQLAIVRKQGDGSHSGARLEGHVNFKHYIIIDDFIRSGSTIATILSTVQELNPHAVQCMAIFCYRRYGETNRSWKFNDLIPQYSLILKNNNILDFYGHNFNDGDCALLQAKFYPKVKV